MSALWGPLLIWSTFLFGHSLWLRRQHDILIMIYYFINALGILLPLVSISSILNWLFFRCGWNMWTRIIYSRMWTWWSDPDSNGSVRTDATRTMRQEELWRPWLCSWCPSIGPCFVLWQKNMCLPYNRTSQTWIWLPCRTDFLFVCQLYLHQRWSAFHCSSSSLGIHCTCNGKFYLFHSVAQCKADLCQTGDFLKVTAPFGYLASIVTSETRCGSVTCPWVLEPQPGQRFNLTFYNFMDSIQSNMCIVLATIEEKNSEVRRDINFCGDTSVISLSTSVSSPVEIRLKVPPKSQQNSEPSIRFLLSYQGKLFSLKMYMWCSGHP